MGRRILSFFGAMAFVCCLLLPNLPAKALTTTVRVAVDENMPPYQYLDTSGKLQGMHIDMMNDIAQSSELIMEYLPYTSMRDAVLDLQKGKVDVVLGAFSTDLPQDGAGMRFTQPLTTNSVCMVVNNRILTRANAAGAYRYIAAFELGTVTFSQVAQFHLRNTSVMGSQRQLYDALAAHEVDTVFAVKDSIQYQMHEGGIDDDYTITLNAMTDVSYALLLRENDRMLFRTLQASIAQLRTSSRYEEILDAWAPNVELVSAQARIKNLFIWIAVLIAVGAIILIGAALFNSRLRQMVKDKTAELSQRMEQLESAGTLTGRLITHSPGGSMLLGKNGEILLMNPKAREIAGLLQSDTQPRDVQTLAVFSEIYREALPLVEQGSGEPVLIRAERADKQVHTYRGQMHPTGTEENAVLVVEDVTQEERKKREIFEQNKNQALNRMIAGLAHEIKNPLMSIRAFASLIDQQGDDPEFQTSFRQYVPAEVDRINRLIETLLNYARPARIQKETFAIGALIEDCLQLVRVSAPRNVVIEGSMAQPLHIYAAKDQIRQALINLLINSIESVETKLTYLQETGALLHVRCTATGENGLVIIEVYDEGTGMSENDIRRCTDPFYTTKETGTGMGLALAKQFVQMNAGQFEIVSREGAHTIMRLTFREVV